MRWLKAVNNSVLLWDAMKYTCSTFPSAGIQLQGKSGYNVPTTHSKADTSLAPHFLFGDSQRMHLEELLNKTHLQWWFTQSLCPRELRQKSQQQLKLQLHWSPQKPSHAEIPDPRLLCLTNSGTFPVYHNCSLVKGLQGYSLSFGFNQLFCSTVKKQFSSWLVAVWGEKKNVFSNWFGYQVQHFRVEVFQWDIHFSIVSPETCRRNEGLLKGLLKCNLSSVPIWISVWWQERLLLLLNEKRINFLTSRCRQNQKLMNL